MAIGDQISQPVDFQIIWSCSSDIEKYGSYFSSPELIEFPTDMPEKNAYAYYYPPCNPHYQASQEEKPPLLLESHGALSSSLLCLISSTVLLVVNYLSGYPTSYNVFLRQ